MGSLTDTLCNQGCQSSFWLSKYSVVISIEPDNER
jgi:hypothetical protein